MLAELRRFVVSVIPFTAATLVGLQPPAGADVVSNAFAPLKYRDIGPAISGGRTTAVAGSDSDPNTYYAGGANGGVWKSVDGGVSWRATFDNEPVAAIGAIALAARDANDVWVGTGEAYPRNDAEEGDGVWHSRNGGKTWTHMGLPDAGTISRISIDPRDPRIVSVAVLGHIYRDAAMRGVFLTRDGGTSWKRVLYLGPSSGASDLVRVPDRPSTLFAGMWQFRRHPWAMSSGGPQGGLFRSDDDGATWRKVAGGGFATGMTGRIGVAAARGGRVYAIVQSKHGELWRSDDGGGRWQHMPHDAYVGARPFYFSRVYVDPANRDRLMNVSLILSLSTNGGRSFHKIATNAGWDYHFVWWSADGRRAIAGSDEGAVLSHDGGARWVQPYALPFAQPYHVGYDEETPSYRVCAGLQDNGSWCGPSSADNGLGVLNRDWYVVGPGDGMYAETDPTDQASIWTTSTNNDPGQIYRFDARTKQTYDVSPSSENDERLLATRAHRFNWDTPLAIAANGRALAGGEAVFETLDRGVHWKAISGDLTRNEKQHQQVSGGPIDDDVSGAENYDTILRIAPSKIDANVIWIGTDDGLVQLSRDGGVTWKDVTSAAFPHYGRAYGIDPGHLSADTAYVAFDDHMRGDDRPHLFVTNDYGTTWRSIVGDLPADLFVRTVREDPRNSALLYAGSRRGVFVTFDRGVHWHPLRANMPATAIYDLQIVPQTDDLLVAAHGRGIWVFDDLRPLQAWNSVGAAAVVAFPPADAYRMFQYAPINQFTDGSVPDGDYVGKNRSTGALFTYYLARPAKSIALTVLDHDGRAVKHLAGRALTRHAGMNRLSWDLAEDGPPRWLATFEQNKGPKTGAEVVPGTYTLHLQVDGTAYDTPVAVKLDPRGTPSLAEATARYEILRQINDEIGGVDTMLNAIDRKMKHADAPTLATLRAFKARLTVDPRNIEDLRTTAQIRERLLDLVGRIGGSSFQAPTESQTAMASQLRSAYDGLAREGRAAGLP